MKLVDYGSFDFRVLLDASDLMRLLGPGTSFAVNLGTGITFEFGGQQTRVEFPQECVVTFELAVMDDVDLVADTARRVRDTTMNEAVRRVMENTLRMLGDPGGEVQ